MPGLHDDGSRLAYVRDPHAERTCAVCGGALFDGVWWVTKFPQGEHGRCRDWTRHPFPFQRQRDVLDRLARRVQREDGAKIARAAVRALDAQRREWPAGGWRAVEACMQTTATARTRLAALGVEAKLLSKI